MCQGCVGNLFGSFGGMRPGVTRRGFLATAAAAAAVAPSALSAFAASPDGADLIFRGGPIIPMVGTAALSRRSRSRTARSRLSARRTP